MNGPKPFVQRAPARDSRWVGSRALALLLAFSAMTTACSHGVNSDTAATTSTTSVLAPFLADPSGSPPARDDPVLTQRIDVAASYLNSNLQNADGATMILAGNLGKRYGIDLLTPWIGRGTTAIREAAAKEQSEGDPSFATAFIRMIDPGWAASPAMLTKLPHSDIFDAIQWLTTTALHCDAPGFPTNWAATATDLATADAAGTVKGDFQGYLETHAAFAIVITAERGCTPPGVEQLRSQLIDSMSTTLRATERVTDLHMEQIAILHELGRSDLVDAAWFTRILQAQQPDGGWLREPNMRTTDWHPTLLAIWALSTYRDPNASGPLMHP